jgi:ABC-type sugar transport system substrate-binding protein
VEIIEVDASWDAQKTDGSDELVRRSGVDGIILNPVDSKSIIPAAKKGLRG